MFDTKLETIEVLGKEYPYKCDMRVLCRLQKEYGDLMEFEDTIRGRKRYYDSYGIREREKDRYTVPDIERVLTTMVWMIEEGIRITEKGMEPPTVEQLMDQEEYSPMELTEIVVEEYNRSFLPRHKPPEEEETTRTEKK